MSRRSVTLLVAAAGVLIALAVAVIATVPFIGGPGTHFNIFAALRSWLSPHDAVVPSSEIFTPGDSPQQVARQDIEEMANSQETATAAALCQLKIAFKT